MLASATVPRATLAARAKAASLRALRTADATPAALYLPVLAAAAYGLISPLQPTDLFVNLKLGEVALDTGAVPLRPLFAHTPLASGAINAPWLTQVLLAQAFRAAGFAGLVLLQAGLCGAAAALVLAAGLRRSGRVLPAAAAAMIALLIGGPFLTLRPQLFSAVLFPLFLLLLTRPLDRRTLVMLPALTALWSSLHGGFVLGLLLVALRVASEVIERELTLRRPRESAGGLLVSGARAALGKSLVLLALCLLAANLNPYGPGVYVYAWEVATHPIVREHVSEWQRPTPNSQNGLLLLGSLALLGLALAYGRPRPRPWDLALLAFGLLAVQAERNLLWWTMASVPLLSLALAKPVARRSDLPRGLADASAVARPSASHRAMGIATLLLVVLVLPWWKEANPLLPPQSRAILAKSTPVMAARFLSEQPGAANLFNAMAWGGYLAWELWPRYRVFTDNLIEAYPPGVWLDYAAISAAEPGWAALLDRYGADYAVLERTTQRSLVAAMDASPGWRRVYGDASAVVFVRCRDK